MSNDSDSDVCDFSSDLNRYMLRARDKFQKSLTARRKENAEESARKQETDDLVFNSDSAAIEKLTLTVEEDVRPSKISAVNLNTCGGTIAKLNKLSDTIQDILKDHALPARRKRASRGRKRRAAPIRKKPVKRRAPIVVIVQSSDEEAQPQNATELPSKNDELNPTLEIKLLWKSSQAKVFKVKKFQALRCIHEYFVNEMGAHPELLFFTVDHVPVDLRDASYVSLRLSGAEVIEGGVLPPSYLDSQVPRPRLADKDPLKFKVQFYASRRKEFAVRCRRSDRIEFVLWQVVQEVGTPVENVRLYFDGRLLNASNSISGLCLEEGDCFDLQIV